MARCDLPALAELASRNEIKLIHINEPLLAAADLVASGIYVAVTDDEGSIINTLTTQRLVAFLATECEMWQALLDRPVFTGTIAEWGFPKYGEPMFSIPGAQS